MTTSVELILLVFDIRCAIVALFRSPEKGSNGQLIGTMAPSKRMKKSKPLVFHLRVNCLRTSETGCGAIQSPGGVSGFDWLSRFFFCVERDTVYCMCSGMQT